MKILIEINFMSFLIIMILEQLKSNGTKMIINKSPQQMVCQTDMIVDTVQG